MGLGAPGGATWAPLRTWPLSQGLLTFGYLVLLSRIGEHMAVDMRRALFSNLLQYRQPRGGLGRGRGAPGGPGGMSGGRASS